MRRQRTALLGLLWGCASAPPDWPATARPLGAIDRDAKASSWAPGREVVVLGRVARAPWQHLIQSLPGKTPDYLDLEGDAGQLVVYWTAAPSCPSRVELTATVVEVRGASKRPEVRSSEADDTIRELQLDVHRVRCVD
jgi:hypothetical protein